MKNGMSFLGCFWRLLDFARYAAPVAATPIAPMFQPLLVEPLLVAPLPPSTKDV